MIITDEMVERATAIVIKELGSENMRRLTFPGEPCTTAVIIEDIVGKALETALKS